ncbi:MAG: sulfotransferase [Phycisphaerae bacterium]
MRKLVYVLSPGHSGSTLLGLLIGAHPQVATVGEVKVVPASFHGAETCACGAPMTQCAFWMRVNGKLQERGLDLRSERFQVHARGGAGAIERIATSQVREGLGEALRTMLLHAWPPVGAVWRRLRGANVALVDSVCEAARRPVFLDTSKDASRLRFLAETRAFDLRVLHLIRDGRAVAYSLIKKGTPAQSAARDWVHEHEQARRLYRAWADPQRTWMQVSYERLCEDPTGALAAMCGFIGIPYDPRMLEFREWESHILGNRMRLNSDHTIALDTSWQENLGDADLATVSRVTAELNRSFGYPEQVPRASRVRTAPEPVGAANG